jgi:hypothetical protein
VTDLPEIPEAAVQAAAEVLFRDYESQYAADHLTWRDFAALARQSLEAALPHLRPGMATEWGTRFLDENGGEHMGADFGTGLQAELFARSLAAAGNSPDWRGIAVTREVSPWTPAPEEEKGNG